MKPYYQNDTTFLYHGDCLEVLPHLNTLGQVDMILADPPYGTTACKWDSIIPLEPMWEQLKRIIKPNGAIVMTSAQPFTSKLVMSNVEMFKYEWIWNKALHSNPLIAKIQPLNAHENVLIFYKKQCVYNPQMETGRVIKRGAERVGSSETKGTAKIVRGKNSTKERYPKRIIDISNANKTDVKHPTQKPVALMEYLIKTYTNEGDTVLDFTMGSGTTGVACKNLNRFFIGIEKEEKYCEIAKERII
jgi:site-specific DNA-methyltransferase (adenine-specific)